MYKEATRSSLTLETLLYEKTCKTLTFLSIHGPWILCYGGLSFCLIMLYTCIINFIFTIPRVFCAKMNKMFNLKLLKQLLEANMLPVEMVVKLQVSVVWSMWKGSICFFIQQHLEPFCFHLSTYTNWVITFWVVVRCCIKHIIVFLP